MPKRMTWDEMVKEYPDMWVVLTDVTYLGNRSADIESALVLKVLPDEEASDERLRTNRQGLHYIYRRTTPYIECLGVNLW